MISENGENERSSLSNVVANQQRPMTTPGKVQKTPGKAIKFATGSTPLRPFSATPMTPSSSREAAIQAKLMSTAERVKKVAGLKEKWAKEKEKKVKTHRERRAEELKRQQQLMLAAVEQRKLALQKNRDIDEAKKKAEKELLISSLETAAQLSRDLAEKFKSRRRQSIALNNEIFERAQKKAQELAQQKKAELDSFSQSKKEDFFAVREAKKLEKAKRRESMAMRTETARKLKDVEKDLTLEAKEQEKSLLDFRYTAWVGEKEYKKQEAIKRRESVAGRLDQWRQQKGLEEQQRDAEHEASLADLDLKREDWKCVQLHKAEQAKRERESIAERLNKWRAENAAVKLNKTEKAEAEAYEFELKTQEREDVAQYKAQLAEQRRQSLTYRLDAARKDKDWERGQATLLAIAAEETRQLEEENRACVTKYKEEEEEARRASLQYRNQVGVQEALRLDGVQKQEQTELVSELDRKHEDWLDVQNYKQSLRDEKRKSLAMRLVHSRREKEAALITHKELLDAVHKDFELRQSVWIDVKNYEQQEKQKRRDSVALRLDSWRAQRMQMEKDAAKKRMEDEERAAIREQELDDIRAAKEALKDKEKLDMLIGKMIF